VVSIIIEANPPGGKVNVLDKDPAELALEGADTVVAHKDPS